MKKKNSLTFGEVLRRTGPAAFSTIIKPTGSSCNMDCSYCYYLGKSELYGNRQPVMSDELLERYIKQYIEGNEVPQVTFVWHGGEPLLLKPDFFKKAVAWQKKYADGKQIDNTLQTNGTLLSDEWCRFFAEHRFLIGLSIDGPKDIHDAFRRNKAGAPTFGKAMEGIRLLQKHSVEYNTLSVVSRLSEGRGTEVYRFLKSIGTRYMQFLPAVEHVVNNTTLKRPVIVPPGTPGSRLAEWSVSARGYGRFLNDIFDEWVLNDVGRYFVQIFDATLANHYGVPSGVCTLAETCGDALAVEHNGDVYPCDHYVYPEFRLGNIGTDTLKDLYRTNRQFNFGLNKRNGLPRECMQCEYYFACKGECPKHRFETTRSGAKNLNTLCEGLQAFFRHVDPYMKYMCRLLDQQKSPAFVIPWARQQMGIM